jgi:hypothetical protein
MYSKNPFVIMFRPWTKEVRVDAAVVVDARIARRNHGWAVGVDGAWKLALGLSINPPNRPLHISGYSS